MYYRIKNKFEVDFLNNIASSKNIPAIVLERMNEITDILDTNYGTTRSSTAIGGYILFFPTKEDYINFAPVIYENYNIDSSLYEYDDVLVSTENMSWKERLFLQSSDDSLVFIYSE